MKANNLLLTITALFFAMMIFSCEEFLDTELQDCEDGWGILKLENKSSNTFQRVSISGTNYGTLDPGEEKTYELPMGEYTITLKGVDGTGGCGAEAMVNIPDCGTVSRFCEY